MPEPTRESEAFNGGKQKGGGEEEGAAGKRKGSSVRDLRVTKDNVVTGGVRRKGTTI
jgi:hypothetical protein